MKITVWNTEQVTIQNYYECCPYSDLFYSTQMMSFNWLNSLWFSFEYPGPRFDFKALIKIIDFINLIITWNLKKWLCFLKFNFLTMYFSACSIVFQREVKLSMWISLPHDGETEKEEGRIREWRKIEDKGFGGDLFLNIYKIEISWSLFFFKVCLFI